MGEADNERARATRLPDTEQKLHALGEEFFKAEGSAPTTRPHPVAAGSPMAQRVLGPFAALLDRARDAYKD